MNPKYAVVLTDRHDAHVVTQLNDIDGPATVVLARTVDIGDDDWRDGVDEIWSDAGIVAHRIRYGGIVPLQTPEGETVFVDMPSPFERRGV